MSRARRGSLFAELAAAITALAALAGVATMAAQDRRAAMALERRAVALETAQNLLARIRGGQSPVLPPAWTIERRAVAPGVVRVRLAGDGVALATLVAEAVP